MSTYGKFETLDEVYAVVLGNIKRNFPVIRRSTFNTIIYEAGLEKVSKGDFKVIVDTVKESAKLQTLYEKSFNGEYALRDIKVYNGIDDDNLFPMVTSYTLDKVANQAQIRQFNKIQRETSAQVFLSQQIAKNMAMQLKSEIDTPILTVKDPVLEQKGKTLVVTPSDWHIGAEVNNISGNIFNQNVAKSRIEEYLQETIHTIDKEKPDTVVIVHLGDFINHAYMHSMNQAFESELEVTQQLALATRLYVSFVTAIAKHVPLTVPVIVGAVGGNHDRYDGNKKNSIYNDNVAYNVVDTLILLSEMGTFPKNVSIKDNRSNIYTLEVNTSNKQILFQHGDRESRNDTAKIPAHIKDYGYDLFFMGHYHYNKAVQEDYARMTYIAGALVGPTTYSETINATKGYPSQLLTVITADNNNVTSTPVFLK